MNAPLLSLVAPVFRRASRAAWRLAALSLLVLLAARPTLAADGWRAGSAAVTITPEKFMWMSGYGGRDKPADGKLTELWAKALVLEDGDGRRACLITLDLVGVDRELSGAICKRLEADLKLPRAQVAIATSHTHSGPVVGRNLAALHYYRIDAEQQKLVDEYARTLEEKVVNVVKQADAALAPAKLAWGVGQATFAVNRRNNPEAQVPELRAAGKLKGPVDHDVPVLTVRGADDGLKTIVFGYACHATVLPFFQWCGDYPGYAQIELEKDRPGCVAMFWAGCGADQNPLPRRKIELAQEYGRQLAKSVEDVLAAGKLTPVAGRLTARYQEVELPLDKLPTRDAIVEESKSTDGYRAARGRLLLDQLAAGKPLASTYPYPVQRWQLGDDVEWIFLGGEVVVDYALRLKGERRGAKTWVAGYANDVMAYIPSRRVLIEGGYEGGGSMVFYGLPTLWAPEVESTLMEGVDELGK